LKEVNKLADIVTGVNSDNVIEEIKSKNNELVVRHTDTQYETDNNGYEVMRFVDAAPFAYDEGLNALKIYGMCSSSDNGGSKHHLKSAATTNATSVKTVSGRINMLNVANLTAAIKFLKLYNKISAPTVGTDVPIMVIPIQANTTLPIVHNDIGIYFSAGIAYAITGAIADADTTAVGANEVIVNMIYS
jgi:hypothetical protein